MESRSWAVRTEEVGLTMVGWRVSGWLYEAGRFSRLQQTSGCYYDYHAARHRRTHTHTHAHTYTLDTHARTPKVAQPEPRVEAGEVRSDVGLF